MSPTTANNIEDELSLGFHDVVQTRSFSRSFRLNPLTRTASHIIFFAFYTDLYTERCEDKPGRSTGKTLLDDPEHSCRAKVGSLLTELRSRDLAKTEWRIY